MCLPSPGRHLNRRFWVAKPAGVLTGPAGHFDASNQVTTGTSIPPCYRDLVRDAFLRATVLFMAALGYSVAASDWPRFLGPSRNGVYSGPLAASWPSGGPRTVRRKSIGQGLAGPVVAGGRLILFHRIGKQEVVEAFDARTGSAQWRYGYATAYRDDFGFDEGPRSVPVVANSRVYTFG